VIGNVPWQDHINVVLRGTALCPLAGDSKVKFVGGNPLPPAVVKAVVVPVEEPRALVDTTYQ